MTVGYDICKTSMPGSSTDFISGSGQEEIEEIAVNHKRVTEATHKTHPYGVHAAVPWIFQL